MISGDGTGDTRYKLPGSGVPEGGPTPTMLHFFCNITRPLHK